LPYFKWRDLPVDQRPPIPADVELSKLKAESQPKTVPVEKQQPVNPIAAPAQMLHPEDFQGLSRNAAHGKPA